MARLSFGNPLLEKEYFTESQYGEFGPDVSYPDLIGPGILGANIKDGILDGDVPCGAGQKRNSAGKCVSEKGENGNGCGWGYVSDGQGGCRDANTCPDGGQPPCDDNGNGTVKTCATHGGAKKCGSWPNCTSCGGCTSDAECGEGKRCHNGSCVEITTGGCPEGQVSAGGECWCEDGSKPPCTGSTVCRDPNTRWDAFTGRCLPIEREIEACRWGRNPHTDECNPNPYFSDWGSTDPDNPYGHPTALGGLPRDTGSGSSAYISGAGLEALDRGLYPSGFVPQSGILSGPEDMFSDGAYMGGSILDMANAGAPSYGEEMFGGQAINPKTVSTSMTPSYGEEAFGGPSPEDIIRMNREGQEAENRRREQENANSVLQTFVNPVVNPVVTNIAPSVTTQTHTASGNPIVSQASQHDIWLARHNALMDKLRNKSEPSSHLLYDI